MIIMRHLTPADPTLGFSPDNHPEESNNKPRHKVSPSFDVLILDMCCFPIALVFKNGQVCVFRVMS